jgi:predicted O-methyltransferase YrrM
MKSIIDKPYSLIKKSLVYGQFWLRSKNRHGVHSPFVYSFIEKVLNASYKDNDVEQERTKLLKDHSIIKFADLGYGKDRSIKISCIAAKSLKKPKEAQLLAKIVRLYEIENVIELGTSLGITTAYMARSNEDVSIQTIEGSKEVLDRAKKLWDNLGINSISAFHSSFDDLLPQLTLNENTLVYIDGNHTYEATLRYFNFFISKFSEAIVLVFDDIHWSEGMEKAWEEITMDKRVFLSIDLFELGVVFLGPRLEKEHFVLRY